MVDLNVTGAGSMDRARGIFGRMWPFVLGEGVLAVVIGMLLITSPVRTALFLLQVLGIYWVLGGVTRVISSLFGRKDHPGWQFRLTGGIIFTLLGAAILAYPLYAAAVTGFVLVYSMAAAAVIGGIFSIAWGVRMMSVVPGEWLSMAGGALSVLIGIMLFAAPFFIMPALLLFVGVFAVLAGTGMILFSLRLRRFSLKPAGRIERRQYVP